MSVGERRAFAGAERAALFLSTDGRCSQCGVELEAGFRKRLSALEATQAAYRRLDVADRETFTEWAKGVD